MGAQMFFKALKDLFCSCSYQPHLKETYLLLAKGLLIGNLFWLLGDLICSSTLGLAAFVSEMLIFYISFLLIVSVTATILIRKLVSRTKLTLVEILHQSRIALFVELAASMLLMAGVSVSCLFAALSRALRSLPVVGYLFRETYDGVEPLFMIALIIGFFVAVALPLMTPFIILMSKHPVAQWYEIFETKIKPRVVACLPTLLAAFTFWLSIECIKWFVEWFFPVSGLLSALIRSAMYTIMETMVFWASLKSILDSARAK